MIEKLLIFSLTTGIISMITPLYHKANGTVD